MEAILRMKTIMEKDTMTKRELLVVPKLLLVNIMMMNTMAKRQGQPRARSLQLNTKSQSPRRLQVP
jgi:hypothetical protein